MFPKSGPLIALVAVCGALSGASSVAQTEEETDDALTPTAQSISVAPAARDDEIAARLRGILEATGWYDDLTVDVRDGVVFLDGVAESEERRDWAQGVASKIEDVVAVANRIDARKPLEWTLAPAVREVEALGRAAVASAPLFALALLILPIAFFAAGFVRRLARRALGRATPSSFLADILARIIAAPVLLLGIYVVLQTAGLTQLALSMLGGAGVIGIVAGFAFRDIAENFLASLLLSIRSPFRQGDFIEVEGRQGLVQSMNTRSTILLSIEGNHIAIPNAAVFKSVIVNYTASPMRREVIDVGVGYDAPLAQVQELIMDVLLAHDAVVDEPAPMVLVDTLGGSSVVVRAYYWFDGHTHSQLRVRSALMRLVKSALIEAGVSMPDEAREIIFPQGVPIIADGAAAPTHGPAHMPPPIPAERAISRAEGSLGSDEIASAALATEVEGSQNLLAR